MISEQKAKDSKAQASEPKGRESKVQDAAARSADETAANTASRQPKRLNALGRAVVLTSMAVAVGVSELIVFSGVATVFSVDVNPSTMPVAWLIVFYALFLVPGVFLMFALINIASVLD